jgi:hypothetical protein
MGVWVRVPHRAPISKNMIEFHQEEIYSYMLGLYLGDGYINLTNEKYQVYKLRITQDGLYPNLIEEHKQALQI